MDILRKAQTHGSFNNWLTNLPEEDLQHISDTLDEASSESGEVTDQDTMAQIVALVIHFSGTEELTEDEIGEKLQMLSITCAMELNVRKGDMTRNGLYSLIDGEETATFSITKQGEDRVKKSLPEVPSKPWLRPVCFFAGHLIVPAKDKPGWYMSGCGRCGLDTHRPWFRRIRSIPWRTERSLVWLANQIARRNNYPGAYWPVYRHIDQQIEGIGTKHSCAAYSYEGIMSLLKQYEDDGLPEPTLRSLISEDGWIDLAEHPEEIQPMLDDLAKGVELLRTKEEQEELNRYEE